MRNFFGHNDPNLHSARKRHYNTKFSNHQEQYALLTFLKP